MHFLAISAAVVLVAVVILVVVINSHYKNHKSSTPVVPPAPTAPVLSSCPASSFGGPWVSYGGTGKNDGYCCGHGGELSPGGTSCVATGMVCSQSSNSNPEAGVVPCSQVVSSQCSAGFSPYGLSGGGFCCSGAVQSSGQHCYGASSCAWKSNPNTGTTVCA